MKYSVSRESTRGKAIRFLVQQHRAVCYTWPRMAWGVRVQHCNQHTAISAAIYYARVPRHYFGLRRCRVTGWSRSSLISHRSSCCLLCNEEIDVDNKRACVPAFALRLIIPSNTHRDRLPVPIMTQACFIYISKDVVSSQNWNWDICNCFERTYYFKFVINRIWFELWHIWVYIYFSIQ